MPGGGCKSRQNGDAVDGVIVFSAEIILPSSSGVPGDGCASRVASCSIVVDATGISNVAGCFCSGEICFGVHEDFGGDANTGAVFCLSVVMLKLT